VHVLPAGPRECVVTASESETGTIRPTRDCFGCENRLYENRRKNRFYEKSQQNQA
jgi:hypothetical protein